MSIPRNKVRNLCVFPVPCSSQLINFPIAEFPRFEIDLSDSLFKLERNLSGKWHSAQKSSNKFSRGACKTRTNTTATRADRQSPDKIFQLHVFALSPVLVRKAESEAF